ncbi:MULTISPECIES: GNAT family N-acetyltransferase [Amycolatopsis]|uniref:GNAT family N-acetyltransferase n=1 Tax=Amycolatopsis sp. CB00013 TaxID=1703945 RepID=UPI00093DB04F|nr:GNAT family N-acetyltransferase [Amycolatopsis sp. CB00013]OKJ92182.1 acetyltransferase [Amycolatopsis sp. CB00013]
MAIILSHPGATVRSVLTEIKTERLLLRRLREADRENIVALQADPETNKFNVVPHTVEGARELYDAWMKQWAEHGFGYLTVSALDEPEVIVGFGGVRYHEWNGERVLNLAYRFWPFAWGKGYATEMAAAAVEWAEREIPDVPVIANIMASNEPSIRVAERLGFTVHTEEEYEGEPSLHLRR